MPLLTELFIFAGDKLQRCRADGAGILLHRILWSEYSFNRETAGPQINLAELVLDNIAHAYL